MRNRHLTALPVLALMTACSSVANTRPSADSYTVVHAQLKSADAVEPVQAANVALDFFDQAGIKPLLGRFFIEGDQRSPVTVVVLSNDVWKERSAASPTVIGRTLELDGRTVTVVGVAPRGFSFPAGTELWTPRGAAAQK